VFKAEGEGDEAAEGGSAESGVLRIRAGAEGVVDEGLELFEEEPAVAPTLAAAEFGVAGGGVLGHAAQAGVGDADEEDRLGETGLNHAVCRGVGEPGMAGDVGGLLVEEVLAVVEVEDREAAVGVVVILAREVDEDGAVVGFGQDRGVEAEAFEARDIGVVVGYERRGTRITLGQSGGWGERGARNG